MLDKTNKRILASIPLTTHTGKVRIKSRSMFSDHGELHFGGSQPFRQNNYVEWQIGYDLVDNKANRTKTTLPHVSFMAANGKRKILYELSEYLYYLHSWDIIPASEIEATLDFVSSLNESDLISNHPDMKITKTLPVEKEINRTLFYEMTLKYPLLVYRFGKFEIIVEILMKERQYAVGIQPMLYLCFPITDLLAQENLIGRTAFPKESARFIIDDSNSNIVIEMIRMFGMLSPPHNKDTIEILKAIQSKA